MTPYHAFRSYVCGHCGHEITVPKACGDRFCSVCGWGSRLRARDQMAELIRLGAYKMGTNAEVDVAIGMHPQFEKFLEQRKDERATLTEVYGALGKIINGGVGKGKAS